MSKAQRDLQWKKRVLEHAVRAGNMRKTCRYFGVSRGGCLSVEAGLRGAWGRRAGQPEALPQVRKMSGLRSCSSAISPTRLVKSSACRKPSNRYSFSR